MKKMPNASGCVGFFVWVIVVEATNGPLVTVFGFQ